MAIVHDWLSVNGGVEVPKYVSKRIEKAWRLESVVIYPPLEFDDAHYCEEKKEYYVTLSRLVEYKRIDIIVEAFNAMPHRIVIRSGFAIGETEAWVWQEVLRFRAILNGIKRCAILPRPKALSLCL